MADRSRTYKDYYEFNKTVLHGFPANPTCLAYDNYHKLLAIGTKNGAVQIYGKPGVEFHFEFEELEVVKLFFVPIKGQLICLCSDDSLHLLQISHQFGAQNGIKSLHTNVHFKNDEVNDITTIALSHSGEIAFIGTKTGNVYLLDVSTFQLREKIISQETVLKSSPNDLKKPGAIESIEEKPNDNGKILIGYSRSLVALWNYEKDEMVQHYIIEQHLESLSWNPDGKRFITSHNDGSYITWTADQNSSNGSSTLPYGPYPCKAITKIIWNSSTNGEYFIFSGGMPRASHGDKEVVSITFIDDSENLDKEKNHVLDFTSKVVDFLTICSADHVPEALALLVEEEIVFIDLTDPDWLQFKLPYLSCLHSSPITCSQHYSNVNTNVYNRIIEAGKLDCNIKYSTNEWPIKGGISKYQSSIDSHDLLITGHEDGTVRFWDASTTSLKHLYTLTLSKLLSIDDDIALIDSDETDLDNEEENEWPPFRKVGNFDPYSDDHRFAIRKISLCPNQGVVAVGGTAGQLVVFELNENAAEYAVDAVKLNLVDDKDGFVWKGHSSLPTRNGKIKFNSGYQPTSLLQINPPAAITSLSISTQWEVIAVGTAHGFGLYDYTTKAVLVNKTTLKPASHSSVTGGEALISRRKSFKKSLRESFRRLRKGRSQKGKRNGQTVTTTTTTGQTKAQNKYDELEARPVERQIEARTEADMMSSMVRYLYFCSSVIVNNTLYPTFWVGTNSGTVFIYILTSDKNASSGTCWQLAKEVQLKHKAPIIFIRLLDSNGAPVFENNSEQVRSSLNRVLICSEEQFKLFSLPNFKALHKFKLTAHEGARVRRLEMGVFANKNNENQIEHSLMCLTNLGDVNIFSIGDFKRKDQKNFLKKEDINGITSLIFSKFGDGYYLKSSSEYQRFTLSSKGTSFPECFIQLPETEQPKLQNSEQIEETITTNQNETITSNDNDTLTPIGNDSTLNNTVDSVIDHIKEPQPTSGDETKVKTNGLTVSNANGSIVQDNA